MGARGMLNKKANYLLFIAIMASILFYTYMDGLAPRGVLLWDVSYALTFLSICFFSFIYIKTQSFQIPVRAYPLAITTILFFVGIIFGIAHPYFSVNYFSGGAGTFALLPIFCLISIPLVRSINTKSAILFGYAVLAGSLISLISSRLNIFPGYFYGVRFDGPKALALAFLAAAAVRARGWKFNIAILGLLIALVLSWYSTWRADVIFSLSAIGYVFINKGSLNYRFFMGISFSILIILILTTFNEQLAKFTYSVIDGTRFEKLVSASGDQSAIGRILEAKDVLVRMSESNLLNIVFGHGHGSQYVPILSSPEPNITENNTIHNIHISLFMFLYRYGIVGAIIYIAFSSFALFKLVSVAASNRDIGVGQHFLVIGGLLIVLRSLFYTPINDPSNLLIIGAYVGVMLFKSPERSQSAAAFVGARNYR